MPPEKASCCSGLLSLRPSQETLSFCLHGSWDATLARQEEVKDEGNRA